MKTVTDATLDRGAIYDARTLGVPRMLVLGIQHLFAMFGATILVPILVNGYFHGEGISVQTTLFFAGVGTLLFHVFSRFKVPAFLGSSFAFLGGFATVAELDTGIFADMSYGEKLPYACGGIVVAGLMYLVLALLFKLIGVKRVMRFLPPQVTAPIIICIGISLMPSAVGNCMVNWPLALIAIAATVIFNLLTMIVQAANGGKPVGGATRFFSLVPILLAVIISYAVALIMQGAGAVNADGSAIINSAAISSASLVGLPEFKLAKFDLTAIFVMAPIAISTMMEHIGDINAISKTTGRDFVEDPGLHCTLLGDGLATALAGFFGAPANTTYGENTGVLTLTKVYDPRCVRIAAVFAVILGFIPKLAEIFGTMPTAIVGGISFILYGTIAGIGLRNIKENDVDLKRPRDLILIAVIFSTFVGFNAYGGLTIPLANGGSFTLTALALASIVGIVLNAVLPGKTYEYGSNPNGDMNRGISLSQTDEAMSGLHHGGEYNW